MLLEWGCEHNMLFGESFSIYYCRVQKFTWNVVGQAKRLLSVENFQYPT